ncbi:MAG: hypothetical protein IPN90_04850 [Elusimicrobia bacterium]|nr:hypothetical protein [Elusimicrobiota bacterium]
MAERTFWEKATILHQEAHRDPGKTFPPFGVITAKDDCGTHQISVALGLGGPDE